MLPSIYNPVWKVVLHWEGILSEAAEEIASAGVRNIYMLM